MRLHSQMLLGRRWLSTRQPVPLSFTAYGDPAKDRALPPLVICHGLFGQKTNWNSVAKALQKRMGSVVYAVDLRNHGASPKTNTMSYADMAADIAKFMQERQDETGFKKMNLLGHSMGGKAVMRMAIEPVGEALLNKLIVEDVSPKGISPSTANFREYISAMRRVDLRRSRREIQDALAPSIPELPIRQFLLTNLQATENGSFEWKCNIDAIDDHVDEVLGFSIPSGAYDGETLFLYGSKSGYVPQSHRPTIRNIFHRVQFEEISNAGHWVHVDQPAAFVNVVVNFLK